MLKKMIVLIGMPGSGKTTVGRILAQHLKVPFVDTDQLIRDREKKPLAQIQKEQGMQAFLAIEQQALLSLDDTPKIVATGGSAVLCEDAMTYLSMVGVVVYLDVDLIMLKKRMGDPRERGVVLGPNQTIASVFFERRPLYQRYANIRIRARNTWPRKVAIQILQILVKKGLADAPEIDKEKKPQ